MLPTSLAAQQTLTGALQGVRGARSSAVTDSAGHFSVAALPAGTHMLVARHLYIGDVAASQIGAVEVYVDGAFFPSRYAARGSCGVVVFWSKAARPIPSPKSVPAPPSP